MHIHDKNHGLCAIPHVEFWWLIITINRNATHRFTRYCHVGVHTMTRMWGERLGIIVGNGWGFTLLSHLSTIPPPSTVSRAYRGNNASRHIARSPFVSRAQHLTQGPSRSSFLFHKFYCKKCLYNNNNNNNNLFPALGLSPCGSGYFTYIQNMKLVTTKFKSGGLHEKHVVATWNLGNHLSICF